MLVPGITLTTSSITSSITIVILGQVITSMFSNYATTCSRPVVCDDMSTHCECIPALKYQHVFNFEHSNCQQVDVLSLANINTC